VPHSDDREVLETLITWKRQQYARIKSVDHLAKAWQQNLLRQIVDTQTDGFAGMLSAMYVGQKLAAIHLGMRSRGVLHSWYPAYATDDPRLSKLSPGLMLWVMLMKQSLDLGIRHVDLGRGGEPYKQSLKTGDILLAEGSVDSRPVVSRCRRAIRSTREWIKESPLGGPLQRTVRGLRSMKNQIHRQR
jgi:CelD/BcsL family acetyltransferase involved in cellulose biosynthesis